MTRLSGGADAVERPGGWEAQNYVQIKTEYAGKTYRFLNDTQVAMLRGSGKTDATIKLVSELLKAKIVFNKTALEAIKSGLEEVRTRSLASLGKVARFFGGKGRVEKKFAALFTELEKRLSKKNIDTSPPFGTGLDQIPPPVFEKTPKKHTHPLSPQHPPLMDEGGASFDGVKPDTGSPAPPVESQTSDKAAVEEKDDRVKDESRAALQEKKPMPEEEVRVQKAFEKVGESIETNPNISGGLANLERVRQGYAELKDRKAASMPAATSALGQKAAAAWNPALKEQLGVLEKKLDQGESVSFDSYDEKKEVMKLLLNQVDTQGKKFHQLCEVEYALIPNGGVFYQKFNEAVAKEKDLRSSFEAKDFAIDPPEAIVREITQKTTELEACHKTLGDILKTTQYGMLETAQRLMGFYQPFSLEGKVLAQSRSKELEDSFSQLKKKYDLGIPFPEAEGTELLKKVKEFNTAVIDADKKQQKLSLALLESKVSNPAAAPEGVRLLYDRVKTSIRDYHLDVKNDMALLDTVIQGYAELEARKMDMPEGKTPTGKTAAAAWNPGLQQQLGVLEEKLNQGESVSFEAYDTKKKDMKSFLTQVDIQEGIALKLFVPLSRRQGEGAFHDEYNQAVIEADRIRDCLREPSFSKEHPSGDLEVFKGNIGALKTQLAMIQQLDVKKASFDRTVIEAKEALRQAQTEQAVIAGCAGKLGIPVEDELTKFTEGLQKAEQKPDEKGMKNLQQFKSQLLTTTAQARDKVKSEIKRALSVSQDDREFFEYVKTVALVFPQSLVKETLLSDEATLDQKAQAFRDTFGEAQVADWQAALKSRLERLASIRTLPDVAFGFVQYKIANMEKLETKSTEENAALAELKQFSGLVAAEQAGRDQCAKLTGLLEKYKTSSALNPTGFTRPAVLAQKTENKKRVEEIRKKVAGFIQTSDAILPVLKSSEGTIGKIHDIFSSESGPFMSFIGQLAEFSRLQVEDSAFLMQLEGTFQGKDKQAVEGIRGVGNVLLPDTMPLPIQAGHPYVQFLKERIDLAIETSASSSDLKMLLETYDIVKHKIQTALPANMELPEEVQFRQKVDWAIVQKRTAEIKADPERACQEAREMFEEGKKELESIDEARRLFDPNYTVDPALEKLAGRLSALEEKLLHKGEEGSLNELVTGLFEYPEKMKGAIDQVRKSAGAAVERATVDTAELAQLYDLALKVPDLSLQEKALSAKEKLQGSVEAFCGDVGVAKAEECKLAQEAYQKQLQEIRATPDGCFLFYKSKRMKVSEEIANLTKEIEVKEKNAGVGTPEEQEIVDLKESREKLRSSNKMASAVEELVDKEANFQANYFRLLEIAAPFKAIIDKGSNLSGAAGDIRRGVYERAKTMFTELEQECLSMEAVGVPLLYELKSSEGDPAKLQALFSSSRFSQWIEHLGKSVQRQATRTALITEIKSEMAGKVGDEAKTGPKNPEVIRTKKEAEEKLAQARLEGKTVSELKSMDEELYGRIAQVERPLEVAFTGFENSLIGTTQMVPRYKMLMEGIWKAAPRAGIAPENVAKLKGAMDSITVVADAVNDRMRTQEERDAHAIAAIVKDPQAAYTKAQEAFLAEGAQLKNIDRAAQIVDPSYKRDSSRETTLLELAQIPSDKAERAIWAKKLFDCRKMWQDIIENPQKSLIVAVAKELATSPSLNQMYNFVSTSPSLEHPEQILALRAAKEEFLSRVALFKEHVCPETAEAYVKARQVYEAILDPITGAKKEDLKLTPQGVFLLFQFNKEKEEREITATLAALESEKTALVKDLSPDPEKQSQLETGLSELKTRKSELEGRRTKAGVFEEMVTTEISYMKALQDCQVVLNEVISKTPKVLALQVEIDRFEKSSQKMKDVLMSLDGNPERLQEYLSGRDFGTYMASYAKFANEFEANRKMLGLRSSKLNLFIQIIQRAPRYELLLKTLYKESQKAHVSEKELMTISDAIVSLQQSLILTEIKEPTRVSAFTVSEKLHTKEMDEMKARIEVTLLNESIVDPERTFLSELRGDIEALQSSSASFSDAIKAAEDKPVERAALFNSDLFQNYSQRLLSFAGKFQSRFVMLNQDPLKDALKPDKKIQDPKTNQMYLFTYLLETPIKRIARYSRLLASEIDKEVAGTPATLAALGEAKASVEQLISKVTQIAY